MAEFAAERLAADLAVPLPMRGLYGFASSDI